LPSLDAHWPIAAVFAVVYVGMFLGGLPTLKLDRSGIALLGAIAVIPLIGSSVEDAARAVDLPTLLLLFSFMVISAQMRLGGFYAAVTRGIVAWRLSPGQLLALVIAVAALLSAVFTNDIVCLAMAPVLVGACVRRRLEPVPFLLALACASNIGSAATLIGNPQNMLIGEVLKMPFGPYTLQALPPVLASLLLLWLLLQRGVRCIHDPEPALDDDDTGRPSTAGKPSRAWRGGRAAGGLPLHRLAARRVGAGRRRRAAAEPALPLVRGS
jgi:Na+/H+ antiporter NhaD/arsenite permease-like protein